MVVVSHNWKSDFEFFTNSMEAGHAASITLYFFTLIWARIDEVE